MFPLKAIPYRMDRNSCWFKIAERLFSRYAPRMFNPTLIFVMFAIRCWSRLFCRMIPRKLSGEIAEKFGVSKQLITLIYQGKCWAWL